MDEISSTGPSAQSVEEVQLMQAAQKDLHHFSSIYVRYFPRIYAYCLRRVSSVQEAEDLTSQIFTRAMVNIEQYRGGFVAAWLFRIAHNVVSTYNASMTVRRGELSFEELPSEIEEQTISLVDDMVQAEEAALLGQIVGQLPNDQQELLRLRIVEGLSSEKIAVRSGKTAGAIRVTLHRLFRRLYTDYARHTGGRPRG
jgi:RNA polymerase sigma-70 factor (ECF subfamily)